MKFTAFTSGQLLIVNGRHPGRGAGRFRGLGHGADSRLNCGVIQSACAASVPVWPRSFRVAEPSRGGGRNRFGTAEPKKRGSVRTSTVLKFSWALCSERQWRGKRATD